MSLPEDLAAHKFHFHSIGRSGTHALTQWFLFQFHQNVSLPVNYANCFNVRTHEFYGAYCTHVTPEKNVLTSICDQGARNDFGLPPRSVWGIEYPDLGRAGTGPIRNKADLLAASDKMKTYLGTSSPIFIMRDYLNLMCSLCSAPDHSPRHEERFRRKFIATTLCWLAFAELYEDKKESFLVYNKWMNSPEYRKVFLESHGMSHFPEKPLVMGTTPLGQPSPWPGSSSFGDRDPSRRKTSSRLSLLADSQKNVLREVFASIDMTPILKAHATIFGMKPEEFDDLLL